MDTETQEYIEGFITVDNASKPFYVSQETTRAIVADCWSKIERELVDANAAFNATSDEPHERILTLLQAAQEIVRHADAIYVLTPMPEESTEG